MSERIEEAWRECSLEVHEEAPPPARIKEAKEAAFPGGPVTVMDTDLEHQKVFRCPDAESRSYKKAVRDELHA